MKRHLDEILLPSARSELEARLSAYIPARRWFRSKSRAVTRVMVEHALSIPVSAAPIALIAARVYFAEGACEDYALLLTCVEGAAGDQLVRARPHLVIGEPYTGELWGARWLVDALGEPEALRGLLELVARGGSVSEDGCVLSFRVLGGGWGMLAAPRPVETEQSNTSIVFGDVILKVIRKLEGGVSPDLELGEFLTRARYAHAPRLLASIEFLRPSGEPCTLGLVHAFVTNEGDAWTFALSTIARAWAPAAATTGDAARALDENVAFVEPLAERIAELHATLAAPAGDPRFAPEPVERSEREALGRAALLSLEGAFALAEERPGHLPSDGLDAMHALRRRESVVRRSVARFIDEGQGCLKTRVHGDLHLGQVLVAGGDFMIIDFEGEPARPLAGRKAKRSPWVDVAGMLRSLHYASFAAWRAAPPSAPSARALAEAWLRDARSRFVRAYFAAAASRNALSGSPRAHDALLRFHLLEKCIYELHYEMNNRPEWVTIPIFGLKQIVEEDDDAS